ncbi:hypothetical protein OOZ63_27565 [Paucibacter sp. PLA-PC-4]|nr:hypothetical protein [Paucibacter sp. PLA-PC-4]
MFQTNGQVTGDIALYAMDECTEGLTLSGQLFLVGGHRADPNGADWGLTNV